ncbi:BppU family phage baseplate upper protein [Enterococcus innesii]|uniref:BppU family phage baseplate upper protein n=1 Tax=Enterococcus innesii TaxID=2839759 RepID=UPI003D14CBF1
MATITHKITLSTTDFNLVGDIKVRQADDETQVFDAVILEHGMIKNFEGLKPFFCLMAREITGQGISEEPVTEYDGSKGTLKYTVSANAMQMVGRNEAYFSFREELSNGEWIEQFSTRSFYYTVERSIYTQPFKDSNYWWTFKELYRQFLEYQESGKKSWEEFVEQNREIIESVDPGGTLLSRIGIFDNFRKWDYEVIEKMSNEFSEREINPKWFGAKFDGVTDDTAAIQKALDSLPNGGIIRFPQNTTTIISDTLLTKGNNTSIIAEKSIIKQIATDKGFFKLQHDYCSFIGGHLIGNGNVSSDIYSGFGIMAIGTDHTIIEKVKFEKISGCSIFLSRIGNRGCKNTLVQQNEIIGDLVEESNRRDDVAAILVGYSGTGYVHENIKINNNKIDGKFTYKIGIGVLGHGREFSIVDNKVSNCLDYGITLYETQYEDYTLYKNLIANNFVSGVGAKSGATTNKGMGIYLQKSHETIVTGNQISETLLNADDSETLMRAGLSINGCSVVKVSNNVIKKANRSGIGIVNAFDVSIDNNSLNECEQFGIRLLNTSMVSINGNSLISIKKNAIYGVFGMRTDGLNSNIGPSGEGMIINNNNLESSSGQVIFLDGSRDSGLLLSTKIIHNIIKSLSSSSFIYINRIRGGHISYNNCDSETATSGIVIASSESENNEVSHNVIRSATTFTLGLSIAGKRTIGLSSNVISSSTIYVSYNGAVLRELGLDLANSTAPTTGTWNVGDKVWNTSPTSGGPIGWVYTNSGWKIIANIL